MPAPPQPATPSLRGVRLVKTYGDGTARRAALHEVTLDLYPGQLALFYDGDHYVKNADRSRLIGAVNFEHKFLNAGLEYLKTTDRPSITRNPADGEGYSVWATPKSPTGWEALLRFDHLKPNLTFENQVRTRTIVGVAYWFPHQGTVTSALLLDYDGQTLDNFAPAVSKQSRLAVHGLVSF